jgi:hypothetical protein
MRKEAFDAVATAEYTLATGEIIKLPITYADATEITATFTASAARVRELLPAERLQPVQLVPGRALIVLAAWQYRRCAQADGTAGEPYNELIVIVPVLYAPVVNLPALPLLLPGRFKNLGGYISHMAVTTAQARDVGIDIWSFPKFLAEITFVDSPHASGVRVSTNRHDILTLEVEKMPTRTSAKDDVLYTFNDGQILRTHFAARGAYGSASLRGRASYTLGAHPLAEDLRRLEIGRVALARSFATNVEARLYPPSERLPAARADNAAALTVGG